MSPSTWFITAAIVLGVLSLGSDAVDAGKRKASAKAGHLKLDYAIPQIRYQHSKTVEITAIPLRLSRVNLSEVNSSQKVPLISQPFDYSNRLLSAPINNDRETLSVFGVEVISGVPPIAILFPSQIKSQPMQDFRVSNFVKY